MVIVFIQINIINDNIKKIKELRKHVKSEDWRMVGLEFKRFDDPWCKFIVRRRGSLHD